MRTVRSPDRLFHNFRASKSVARRSWPTWWWGYKIMKGPVGRRIRENCSNCKTYFATSYIISWKQGTVSNCANVMTAINVLSFQVDLYLSRDLDSRFSDRELYAVSDWLASKKPIHSMRDHYGHFIAMLGKSIIHSNKKNRTRVYYP